MQKENKHSSNTQQSRSRSSSYSRSRSPKSAGGHQAEEEMDDSQEKPKTNEGKDSYSGQSRKSRRRHRNKYNDYDKQESDNNRSDSEGAHSSRQSGKSKPLSFEEELEAMKKQILERSKSQDTGQMEEDLAEKEAANVSNEAMGDLEAEESNVVDVLIE